MMSELKDQRPDPPLPPDLPEPKNSQVDSSSEQVSDSAEHVAPATDAETNADKGEAASGEGEVERPADGGEQAKALANFDRETPVEAQPATAHGEVQDQGESAARPNRGDGAESSEKTAEAVNTTAELALEVQGAGQGEALVEGMAKFDERRSREGHTPGGPVEAQGDGASGAAPDRGDGSQLSEREAEVASAEAELEPAAAGGEQAQAVAQLDDKPSREQHTPGGPVEGLGDGASGAGRAVPKSEGQPAVDDAPALGSRASLDMPPSPPYRRDALPELTGTERDAFDGGRYEVRDVAGGERVWRAEAERDEHPGRWLGDQPAFTKDDADSRYNAAKWGNQLEVMREYRLRHDLTLYWGKVEGATGDQGFVPEDIPREHLDELLQRTDQWRLT